MARIYHVAAVLTERDSALLGSPGKRLHATIAYSREWFPYRPRHDIYPMVLVPPFREDEFGSVRVVRFQDWGLDRRHQELVAAGAEWDYPDFKSHITVPGFVAVAEVPWLVLEHEYYQTWDEG